MALSETALRAALTETEILALTLWAEARSEPIEGIVAVGWVIKNRRAHPRRYRATAGTYAAVCFAPMQFSCWNRGTDANHVRLIALAQRIAAGEDPIDPAWRECAWVAAGLVDDLLRDNTRGSTHYLTADLFATAKAPRWARLLHTVGTIGAHVFLIEPAERSLTA